MRYRNLLPAGLFLCSLLITIGTAFSQVSSTLDPNEQPANTATIEELEASGAIDPYKVMVIPFEPKLYMSDIDREIAKEQGLSYRQISSRMRYGLVTNTHVEAQQTNKAILMLSDDPEVQADLAYIYMSIGYDFKELETEEDKEKQGSKVGQFFGKVSSKFKKDRPEETPGTTVKEGQLYATPYEGERYMATRIINPNMLNYLSGKYGTGLYLFVNQLNIQKAADTDWRDLEAEDYKREIKAHFTIMDWKGKEVYGGVAKYYFSSRVNDMNKIIKTMFRMVARQMVEHLPTPSLTLAKEKQVPEERTEMEKY